VWYLLLIAAIALIGCTGEKVKVDEKEPEVSVDTSGYLSQLILIEDDGWKAIAVFQLPNPCHKMKFDGMTKKGNTIYLSFTHIPPKPGEVCIQVIQEYKEEIKIGKLGNGKYFVIVLVNGVESGRAELTI
jgi:hypothetical protein